MGKGIRSPSPHGAGHHCPWHRAFPRSGERSPALTPRHLPGAMGHGRGARHIQEPHPSLPRHHDGCWRAVLSLPRASPDTRATAEPHPGTRRGQRDPCHEDPSTPPPATATLTSLHGEEEEEEEGSGGAAPAAGSHGPGARQPGHGFASASAGSRRGTGARCPPGAYVGHEPSQPARPRRHIDWWKLGPAVTKGTTSSPRPSHPDPGPQPRTLGWRDGVSR